MTDEKQFDAENVEREARRGRKFSMEDIVAREAGGMFKGISAVPLLTQAENRISHFLRTSLRDPSGALVRTLELLLNGNDRLLGSCLDAPLDALGILLGRILASDDSLHEFVRRVDQQYGQMYQERPHFQRPGQEPHPDDEYTHESVRVALEQLRARLRGGRE